MAKPFAFSFTHIDMFETCPKKYYHLHDAKDVKDEDSSFAAEGNEIHAALKARVIDKTPLPVEMRHMEQLAAKFANAPGDKKGEMKLALRRDFSPCASFASDTYVRAIIDLLVVQGTTAIIVDWKTGKRKVNDLGQANHTQLGLAAAVLSRWMPEIQLFKTLLVWVAENKVDPKNYALSNIVQVWANIIPRANAIEQARNTVVYEARPSGLCHGYCPVKSCPHFRERSR